MNEEPEGIWKAAVMK